MNPQIMSLRAQRGNSPVYADFCFARICGICGGSLELFYAKGLKKQVTLPLGMDGIDLYLREGAHAGKKPNLSWAS